MILCLATIHRINRPPNTEAETVAFAQKRLDEGFSTYQIATELHMAQSTLSRKLRNNGVYASRMNKASM